MPPKFKLKVPKFLKSVKYNLAGVNGLFLTTGIVLIIVGVVAIVAFSPYDSFITNKFTNIPAFTIATGIIILLGALLGFYAAISEHFYFIAGYVVLLLIVLIFELSIVIAGFALKNDAVTEIRPTMSESLQLYTTNIEIAKMWDDLQMEFACCGVVGRNDYISNRIPVSCCPIPIGTITPFECGTPNAYTVGCSNVLGPWLADYAHALGVCALVCLSIQILITVISGWLAWRSKFEEVELEQ